jgi:hypothetical protein
MIQHGMIEKRPVVASRQEVNISNKPEIFDSCCWKLCAVAQWLLQEEEYLVFRFILHLLGRSFWLMHKIGRGG